MGTELISKSEKSLPRKQHNFPSYWAVVHPVKDQMNVKIHFQTDFFTNLKV